MVTNGDVIEDVIESFLDRGKVASKRISIQNDLCFWVILGRATQSVT
jgi:hypothetical protein